MTREENFSKIYGEFLNTPKREKKYTSKEIVMDFLKQNPESWYFVWELMGAKPLGWVSHKVDVALSELSREGRIEIRYVGKYAVYGLALPKRQMKLI